MLGKSGAFFREIGGRGRRIRERKKSVSFVAGMEKRVVSLKTIFFLIFFAKFATDEGEVRRINYNPNLLLVKNSNRLSGQDKIEICGVSFNACSFRIFLLKEIFLRIKRVQTWRKVPRFVRILPILSGFESIYSVYMCVKVFAS